MYDLKYIVEQFFVSFVSNRAQPAAILGNMAEDGEWWVAGSTRMSGRWSKRAMLKQLAGLSEIARDGVHFKPKGWVIEDEKVAVEVEGRMSLKDGREYKNDYHFIFEFKDGKIAEIREYMDTGYVIGIFGSDDNS